MITGLYSSCCFDLIRDTGDNGHIGFPELIDDLSAELSFLNDILFLSAGSAPFHHFFVCLNRVKYDC